MNKIHNKTSNNIVINRRARFDFYIKQCFEAGIVLQGWEVKSLRKGNAQITESYIQLKKGEAWIIKSTISPLLSASTHIKPNPYRNRKLLLHKKELQSLIGVMEKRSYSLIPTKIYWNKSKVKIELSVAIGKKKYDKRKLIKDREWSRTKERIIKK